MFGFTILKIEGENMDEKLVKKRFKPTSRAIKLGKTDIDLAKICQDPRLVEDDLVQVIKEDWGEARYLDWETMLHPFAEASDIIVQDEYLMDTYPALYTDPQDICKDCHLGPCDLTKANGVCGIDHKSQQAKLSLRVACRGALSQAVDCSELLHYAMKEFGGDTKIGFGKRHDISDQALGIAAFTGQYVQKLADLNISLLYAQGQLNKCMLASFQGTGSSRDFENMTFHAGSMLFVIQYIAEMVKVACFGLQESGNYDMIELNEWPPVDLKGGIGNIDSGKPVIAFLGDNMIPAWCAINYLKENNLTDKIELCGMGPVALDVGRFYKNIRVLGGMMNAVKNIRTGFADVIVASTACIQIDILNEAKKAGSKLIWVGAQGLGLEDLTYKDIDDIAKELSGSDAVWCRDFDKVGDVAVKVAQQCKGKGISVKSDADVKNEAGKCKDDCDLCFNVCPNSLLISQAIKKAKSDGISALADVERGCIMCGKCDNICPANIPIRDLIAAAYAQREQEDKSKYRMRSGRGNMAEDEIGRSAFTLMNSPGFTWILSCGGAKESEDVGWMANHLINKGCVGLVAGCGAMEAGQYVDENTGQFLFEKYTCEYAVKNISTLGGCTTHPFLQDAASHWSRTGVHIAHYANFIEVADVNYKLLSPPVILWGSCPDRMYTIASALIRAGHQVIVGPVSGHEFKRYLPGNHFDREKWFVWDTSNGRKVETEPGQEHALIPVETKEEAIITYWQLLQKPGSSCSVFRLLSLGPYITEHQQYFGELPDDWQWFCTTAADLPVRQKAKLLKILREEHGWETQGVTITKARHRDGRLLDPDTFAHEYSTHEARFFTKTPKLVTRVAKEKLRKEGYKI